MEFPAFSQFIDIIEEGPRGPWIRRREGDYDNSTYMKQAEAAVRKLYPNLRSIQLVDGDPVQGKLVFHIDSLKIGTLGVVMQFKRLFRSTSKGTWVEDGNFRI